MIYSKLSKTASLPVTASVLRFCHSHLLMMKAKRQYYQMPNRSGSLSQNNGYPSSLTESPTQPTICGYRDTAKGEGMAKKETLMCMARCKRKDGRIADYYVHRMGGGVVIIGPNLERYRCPPGGDKHRGRTNRNCQSLPRRSDINHRWSLKYPGALSGTAPVFDRAPPRAIKASDMQCP